MKAMLPSLKEKKRYLAYEVLADKIFDASTIADAINQASLEYLGTLGMGKAGIQVLKETYKNNKGLIKVGHKYVDDLKASLTFIKKINNQKATVRSIGTSGIIKKAKERYIETEIKKNKVSKLSKKAVEA